ncbi:MAG: hypothetical protein HKP30_03720 [Myxococcales bacterium]|nr:hypothetical protein [Myxococcales bacterium]
MRRLDRTSFLVLGMLALLASTGCGLRGAVEGWFAPPEGPQPDLSRGVEVVDQRAILEFQERAQAFYDRLSLRRFNTHATYTDPVLRDHFRDDAAFFDYYADLAHALDQEVAEQNRVLVAEVKEFALEGPGRATVQVRLRSNNGKPLRYWTVVSERTDVWERVDGIWWVVPGKI